ncbi:MAG: diguanylate cyclase [Cyanobacteria bacterium J06597_1]
MGASSSDDFDDTSVAGRHEPIRLGGINLTSYLAREFDSRQEWVLMYIDLRYFRAYNQFYGFVAGEQMLKAMQLLLLAELPDNCQLFRAGGDEYLAFSTPDRGPQDAARICERWKHIRGQFYHEQDARRGFLVGSGRRGIGCRCPLVRLCVGMVSSDRYSNPSQQIADICSAAVATNSLARCQRQSTYVTEEQLIRALDQQDDASPAQQTALTMWLHARAPKGKVLGVIPDAALAYLLQVRLELEGYPVRLTSTAREAAHLIEQWNPEVVVADPNPVLDSCRFLRTLLPEPDMLLVMLASESDRSAVLEAGADLYVPKPFDVRDLLYWIERLRQSHLKAVDATPYSARPYAFTPGSWPSHKDNANPIKD